VTEWLVFGHVVGATMWVGGAIAGSILVLRGRSSDADDKLATLRIMDRVGPIFPIGATLVLGFGIWMVIDSPTIGFGDTWLIVAYVAIGLSGAVQAVVAPRVERVRELLEAGDGAAHDAWAKLARVVPLDATLLIVAVWAMTTKPGV
jgi:uncharacterized membrane protein